MNLRNLKLRNTIKCECGKELSYQNVVPPLKINNDFTYYGGRVDKYSKVKCDCGNEYLGLIDNCYKVFDTMLLKEIAKNKKCETDIINNKPEVISDIKVIQEENEKDFDNIENSEQYVCPKCGKVCKSQAGLTVHCKKCVNEQK